MTDSVGHFHPLLFSACHRQRGWSHQQADALPGVSEFLSDTGKHLVKFRVVCLAHAAIEKDVLHGFERLFRLPCDSAHDKRAFVCGGLLHAVLVGSLDRVVEVPAGHDLQATVVGTLERLHDADDGAFPVVLCAFGDFLVFLYLRVGEHSGHGFLRLFHSDPAVGEALVGDFRAGEQSVRVTERRGDFLQAALSACVVTDGNDAVFAGGTVDRFRDLVLAEEAVRRDEQLHGVGAVVGVHYGEVAANLVAGAADIHAVAEADLREDSRTVAPGTDVLELDVSDVGHLPDDAERVLVLDGLVPVGEAVSRDDGLRAGLVGTDGGEHPGRDVNAIDEGEGFGHFGRELEVLLVEGGVDFFEDFGIHGFISLMIVLFLLNRGLPGRGSRRAL